MTRRRIAYFTPLHPVRSGISEWSEDFLPHLAAWVDVDVVIGPYRPTTEAIRRDFNVIQADEFLRNKTAYDCALYQVGNNLHHHRYMVRCMADAPGILHLQDYCMQYLVLGLTLKKGHLTALEAALRPDYGEQAHSLARRLLFHTIDPNSLSLAGPLIRMSKGVVVHSRHTLKRVQDEHPHTPVTFIPMAMPLPALGNDGHELRAKYGIGQNEFVLVSLSILSHAKRFDIVLSALQDLRNAGHVVTFLIVSGGTFGAEARRLVDKHGLKDVVRRTGWVPPEQYRDYTMLSDVVIDLRQTTGAETASSLLRAFAAGKPAIVSTHDTFRELPDDICLKVDLECEPATRFREAVETLIMQRDRLVAMGQAARRYAETNLSLEASAPLYRDFIDEICETSAPSPGDRALAEPATPLGQRLLVSSIYRLCRILHLRNTYGFKDLIGRCCRAFRRQA